jgi:hypothetical protein
MLTGWRGYLGVGSESLGMGKVNGAFLISDMACHGGIGELIFGQFSRDIT